MKGWLYCNYVITKKGFLLLCKLLSNDFILSGSSQLLRQLGCISAIDTCKFELKMAVKCRGPCYRHRSTSDWFAILMFSPSVQSLTAVKGYGTNSKTVWDVHTWLQESIVVCSRKVCLFVCCLTSQQHASVSQRRSCTDNFTWCHIEVEVADQTFYLTQSQYADTGPTSPSWPYNTRCLAG